MDGIENSSRESAAASELGASIRDERPRSRDARSVLYRSHVSKSHASRGQVESRNSLSLQHLVWSSYLRGRRAGPSSNSTKSWGVPIEKEVPPQSGRGLLR
jgi:hypothetical protein